MSGLGLGTSDGLKVPIPLCRMVESTLKPAKVTLTQALENAMAFHPVTQIGATHTAAAIQPGDPGLAVGGIDSVGLTAQANELEALAQQHDHALADYDAANHA